MHGGSSGINTEFRGRISSYSREHFVVFVECAEVLIKADLKSLLWKCYPRVKLLQKN